MGRFDTFIAEMVCPSCGTFQKTEWTTKQFDSWFERIEQGKDVREPFTRTVRGEEEFPCHYSFSGVKNRDFRCLAHCEKCQILFQGTGQIQNYIFTGVTDVHQYVHP